MLTMAAPSAGAATLPVAPAAPPRDRLLPLPASDVALDGGLLGTRVQRSVLARLLVVDENDLLDAFERREVPHQDWQGEHVGKFLHAGSLAWASLPGASQEHAQLGAKLARVVARLLATQEPDGYLGTYKKAQRWTSWDVWVHKYVLIGLLAYHEQTGDEASLAACTRIAALLDATFADPAQGGRDLNKVGSHGGLASDSVLEPLVVLARRTGDVHALALAQRIVARYDAPGGPRVVSSLESVHRVDKVANGKAYELLSNLVGVLELYRTTGEPRLLAAAVNAWDDVVAHRHYVTGGLSSREHFLDDFVLPNEIAANVGETCVSVTWEQLNWQLLRLTGEPRFAEEAERVLYNHLLAAQKPSGESWAYYTSLAGHKPYSPRTTCCLSSGPRGLALAPSVAFLRSRDDGGVVVSLLVPGHAMLTLPSGSVGLAIDGELATTGRSEIRVTPTRGHARFALQVRVPGWARRASLAVVERSGRRVPVPATPGAYARIERAFAAGDKVVLEAELSAELVAGEHGNEGLAALRRGPFVMALDAAHNPAVTSFRRVELATEPGAPLELVAAPDHALADEAVFRTAGQIDGVAGPLYVTPFASVGQDGRSPYVVWLRRRGRADAAQGIKPLVSWWVHDARDRTSPAPGVADDGWRPVRAGDDVFEGRVGYAWYRQSVKAQPYQRLRFRSINDNAAVFLNGKLASQFDKIGQVFEVPLEGHWRQRPGQLAELEIFVFVENKGGPGGLLDDVELVGAAP